jgi:SAM-dependent methyltransferase
VIDPATAAFLRERITPRALAAWSGTDRLSTLPLRIPAAQLGTTPAAAVLELFIGDGEVVRDPRWPDFGDLVRVVGDTLCAKVSVLPLGKGLIVCDRFDTDDSMNFVCWPDDSSYHLASALPPGRRARWLDLGCGSACAEVMRPELATRILAADLNPRATRYARLGLELSGISHVDVVTTDLATGIDGRFDLITCNAPIPGLGESAIWRATDSDFFERLFADARRCASEDGMVVVHGVLDALRPIVAGLPGERVVVAYTPEDLFGFGIVWWRPHAENRFVWTRRLLTGDRPHLTHDDRLAVL